ncbi:MAG: hypothetical protein OT477_00990 [Chloroflexi bacterium]|nr:hypothetical protein [Chloroflexota bacterium]
MPRIAPIQPRRSGRTAPAPRTTKRQEPRLVDDTPGRRGHRAGTAQACPELAEGWSLNTKYIPFCKLPPITGKAARPDAAAQSTNHPSFTTVLARPKATAYALSDALT